MMLRSALLCLVIVCCCAAVGLAGETYHLLLGSKLSSFDHYPVIEADGRMFISLDVLTALAPAAGARDFGMSAGQDEAPAVPAEHEHEDEDDAPSAGLATDIEQGLQETVDLLEPTKQAAPLEAGFRRIMLAANTVDLSTGAIVPVVRINGEEVPKGELKVWRKKGYMSAANFGKLGLQLSYNHIEQLYQVVGLIHRVEYRREEPALVLSSLTPLTLVGEQEDKEDKDDKDAKPESLEEKITVTVEGGFFADTASKEYKGDEYMTRVGFKNQQSMGRSFIFIRQPSRTGYRTMSDPNVGFSKVKFGNYFQVASYNLSSSGEISLNVQLGAPCTITHEIVPSPWRVVIDFPCAIYEDATQQIAVEQGHVQGIRVGTPKPGQVRVVIDLNQQLDYRVLSKDDGARYFIQLFPSAPAIATAGQRRSGRVIMLDAGHGGSDPGAQGIVSGVWEAPLALSITEMTAAELRGMGYQVLMTRRDNSFVSLGARTDYANAVLPYVFVSIHCNTIADPDFEGPISFYYKGSQEGSRLASLIQADLVAATKAKDIGTRDWGDFFVLRETVMPSVLVECGFLSHRDECTRLADRAYQQKVARGIAAGIDRYVAGQ